MEGGQRVDEKISCVLGGFRRLTTVGEGANFSYACCTVEVAWIQAHAPLSQDRSLQPSSPEPQGDTSTLLAGQVSHFMLSLGCPIPRKTGFKLPLPKLRAKSLRTIVLVLVADLWVRDCNEG